MEQPVHTNERIDRELTGQTVSTSHYDVIPIARLQGRWRISESDKHDFGYAWLKLQPDRITVRDRSGGTAEIKLIDKNAQTAAALGRIALGIAAVCLAIPLARKLFH
jgi:hypothetical protein